MKNIRIFYLKIFIFLVVKFSMYLNRRVFVMNLILSTCKKVHFLTLRPKYDVESLMDQSVYSIFLHLFQGLQLYFCTCHR